MATLRELSKITGYSIATISRVLNGDEALKVTENTRSLILEAAGKADYPSKRYISKKNQTEQHIKIGIVEMEATGELERDPYYLYVKSNVEKCCFSNGIETYVMQYNTNEDCYRSAADRELDGILAIGQFDERQITAMEEYTSRIVFLESAPFPERFCSVTPDYEVGIRQGVEYLLAKRHRKIVFAGPEFSPDSTCRPAPEKRRKYFSDYLKHYKGRAEGILLDIDEEDAPAQILQYLDKIDDMEDKPTAFFAYNEVTAMEILKAVQSRGGHVPEDYSILSYNDTILATMTQPQLSGIRINIEEMVKNAVRLMQRTVKGEEEIPLKISVPSSLSERESVKFLPFVY